MSLSEIENKKRDSESEENSEEEEEEEDEINPKERKIIEEEYKIWKKNSPFLYDFLMTYEIEWPSLTVQWLPDTLVSTGNLEKFYNPKFILGTQSDGCEPNYLMIAEATLPAENTEIDARKFDDERNEFVI